MGRREDEARHRRKFPEKHRDKHLKKLYGLPAGEFDRLLAAQGGLCAICHQICSTGARLCVDHDHATGRIRGLLCRRCNRALGAMKDSADLFRSAAEYLCRNDS